MSAKTQRETGPDCWCQGRPCPTFYMRHTIAFSEEANMEIISAVYRCPKCDSRKARPEKWRKVDG